MNALLQPNHDLGTLLTELEVRIARRADQLMHEDGGKNPARDFWLEAEQEVWPDAAPALATSVS